MCIVQNFRPTPVPSRRFKALMHACTANQAKSQNDAGYVCVPVPTCRCYFYQRHPSTVLLPHCAACMTLSAVGEKVQDSAA